MLYSCSCLARFVQLQCCAWACALIRFSIPHMSHHATTRWPNVHNMLDPTMLRSVAFKVANVWLEIANAGPTMLGSVVLKCCDHLARGLG